MTFARYQERIALAVNSRDDSPLAVRHGAPQRKPQEQPSTSSNQPPQETSKSTQPLTFSAVERLSQTFRQTNLRFEIHAARTVGHLSGAYATIHDKLLVGDQQIRRAYNLDGGQITLEKRKFIASELFAIVQVLQQVASAKILHEGVKQMYDAHVALEPLATNKHNLRYTITEEMIDRYINSNRENLPQNMTGEELRELAAAELKESQQRRFSLQGLIADGQRLFHTIVAGDHSPHEVKAWLNRVTDIVTAPIQFQITQRIRAAKAMTAGAQTKREKLPSTQTKKATPASAAELTPIDASKAPSPTPDTSSLIIEDPSANLEGEGLTPELSDNEAIPAQEHPTQATRDEDLEPIPEEELGLEVLPDDELEEEPASPSEPFSMPDDELEVEPEVKPDPSDNLSSAEAPDIVEEPAQVEEPAEVEELDVVEEPAHVEESAEVEELDVETSSSSPVPTPIK